MTEMTSRWQVVEGDAQWKARFFADRQKSWTARFEDRLATGTTHIIVTHPAGDIDQVEGLVKGYDPGARRI